MAGTELLISIVSQATGKGFLDSEKSVKKLQKNVKSLGKTIGVTFAVGAVVAFGKAAVKAFSEDEKAAIKLSRAVENLGIGFANPAINKFIEDLERSAGIADDVLRPAFQNLLNTTGSLTKSQELLNNAITISRASGVDLATVTKDLTKAYLGSNKGLEKYNTGLTKAEIESKSFSQVLGVLLKQSAGAAEDYLSSTAYQMEVLSIAGVNASEIIGGGLVDAFAMIAGGTEASDAAIGIEMVATAVANLARGAGAAVSGIPTLLKSLKNLPKNIFTGFVGASAGINITTPTENNKLTVSEKKQKEALAKLEAAAVKRAKQLADLAKKQANAEILKRKEKEKQAKLDKAALALGKGEDVFDLDKIQVQAALLAKQDEINKLGVNATDQQKLQLANDLTRLSIKQTMAQLEDAIAAQDVEAATRLAKKLNTDLAILSVLQNQEFKLKDINEILDKFKSKDLINLKNLDDALLKLLEMTKLDLKFLCGTALGTTTTTTGPKTTTQTVTKPNGSCPSGMGIYQQIFIDGVLSSETFTACTTPANVVPKLFNTTSSSTSTAKIAEEIATLSNLRSTTQKGTGINFLLKEQIDTLTDAMSTNALNALGDEQARLREFRIAERPGIGADSMFDPAFFRRGEEKGNTYNVNINAGVIGNEDGVATVVQKAILELERRGDPLRYTGGL
jgi:hypothetical protein